MNDPRQPVGVGPLPDPSGDPVAARLAEVLESEAARIEPSDRLDQVRALVARPGHHWWPLVAGVAAVALVGGGSWALLDRDRGGSTRPQTTPVAAPTTPTRSSTPTPTTSPSATATPRSVPVTLPVYYLGRQVKGLFREFQRTTVPADNQVQTVEQALRLAVSPTAPTRPGDASPWLPGTSAALRSEFVNTEQLFVFLPAQEEQPRGRTAEQARLAAQQLVWTATATLQDPRLSVRILFGDRAGRLFGSLSTKPLFHRPPGDQSFEDLSAIWVLAPADGATAHSPVTFSGQACTFEANVAWRITGGGPTTRGPIIRSGRTTATPCGSQRGTWSVSVAGLSPGAYTFRAYELSPKGDGSYEGLDSTTFVVR
jgi:hypothetical protein